MNRLFVAVLALASMVALGQSPDVVPFVEFRPTWTVRSGAKNLFHYYDEDARYSLVGLKMLLETGHRVYVAQRVERIDNSGDPDTVDEYYVEDRGEWRVGKQYLPFGRRGLLRETVLAARIDLDFISDELPLAVAACDGGSGRPRGVVARLGRSVGASVATGKHFGIQATSFTAVQAPETATGVGRGHRLILGLDAARSFGSGFATFEAVALREGHTAADRDRALTEARIDFRVPGRLPYRVGASWARDWSDSRDYFAIRGELGTGERISYSPVLRFEGRKFASFGLSAVVKL
ncbi:MAG: hypothetical protein KF884_08160 [Fimbriimonadaceae bacterium]|nr:hypothetical protein [Fimbriimonadaceae bacterium]QYK57523.1 MAG: hypothetical protein KF884_08160 [Fimbriimonadaceae bacterium]